MAYRPISQRPSDVNLVVLSVLLPHLALDSNLLENFKVKHGRHNTFGFRSGKNSRVDSLNQLISRNKVIKRFFPKTPFESVEG